MFSSLLVSEYDATAVLIMIIKNISFIEITNLSRGVRQNYNMRIVCFVFVNKHVFDHCVSPFTICDQVATLS